jgi:hypothetical protein
VGESDSVQFGRGVVLWEKGNISCTCNIAANNLIEITLCVNDRPIHRQWFTDGESASDYALAKMRAYNVIEWPS